MSRNTSLACLLLLLLAACSSASNEQNSSADSFDDDGDDVHVTDSNDDDDQNGDAATDLRTDGPADAAEDSSVDDDDNGGDDETAETGSDAPTSDSDLRDAAELNDAATSDTGVSDTGADADSSTETDEGSAADATVDADGDADTTTDAPDADVSSDTGEHCMDRCEPNNSAGTLYNLGDFDCSDENTLDALVLGDGDIDWFGFVSRDAVGCDSSAVVEATSELALDLCVYVECQSASLDTLDCVPPAVLVTSSGGISGCCASNERIELDFDCAGLGPDDAAFSVSVTRDEAVCGSYTLRWSP